MTEYRSPNFPALFIDDQLELRNFDRNLITALGDWDFVLRAILQGGLHFTDNVDISYVTFTSGAVVDTQESIAHGLGKVPTGYIVVTRNKAAIPYDGGTAHDATNLYLKSNVASTTFKLMVF